MRKPRGRTVMDSALQWEAIDPPQRRTYHFAGAPPITVRGVVKARHDPGHGDNNGVVIVLLTAAGPWWVIPPGWLACEVEETNGEAKCEPRTS